MHFYETNQLDLTGENGQIYFEYDTKNSKYQLAKYNKDRVEEILKTNAEASAWIVRVEADVKE